MKKFVIVSDSHNRTYEDRINGVYERHPDADYYIHCGDICLPPERTDQRWMIVRGNMDFLFDYPEYRFIDTEHHTILILHGNGLFSGYPDLIALSVYAKYMGADTLIFGHSHLYCDQEYNGIRLLNPGSLWQCRDGSPGSYMILVEEDDGTLKAERKFWNKNVQEQNA